MIDCLVSQLEAEIELNFYKIGGGDFRPNINLNVDVDAMLEDVEKQGEEYKLQIDVLNPLNVGVPIKCITEVELPRTTVIQISKCNITAFVNFLVNNAHIIMPHDNCTCTKFVRSQYQNNEYHYTFCPSSPHYEIVHLLKDNEIIDAVHYFNELFFKKVNYFNTYFVCN
jgi:hypothetical protein